MTSSPSKLAYNKLRYARPEVKAAARERAHTAKGIASRDKYNHSAKSAEASRRHLAKKRASLPSSKEFFMQKARKVRYSAKQQNVPCSVDWRDLEKQFLLQGGLCFYTGAPLELRYKQRSDAHLSLSVDKIVPCDGYVAGNIVLCTVAVNLRKNDATLADLLQMGEWYGKVVAMRPDLAVEAIEI